MLLYNIITQIRSINHTKSR